MSSALAIADVEATSAARFQHPQSASYLSVGPVLAPTTQYEMNVRATVRLRRTICGTASATCLPLQLLFETDTRGHTPYIASHISLRKLLSHLAEIPILVDSNAQTLPACLSAASANFMAEWADAI